ncbi:unnamed protein product [Adineta ricciae]|uniref:MULE transposase domain-containing protein n=1 Tax=Adineta ricciae TaxID=249248 RepID=A0A815WKZ1_ADIRI|nr:unnamed protein product [Adineta ricciae]CAF1608715.1 unnamed protein product [Adineta ricciae]
MASSENVGNDSSRYAELIKSTKNSLKISIYGFLYVKDKNRNDSYYWVCERKGQKATKCTARAVTLCVGTQHKIEKFDANEHNHAAEARRFSSLKACIQMKELAQISNDLPIQIITNVIATLPQHIQPCLPRKNALRQQANRAKRVCVEEVEPKALNDFILPDMYCITLKSVPFAEDISLGEERILVFTTMENLKWLQNAKFWIMDGTFKTVPTLFRQLYTIHAPAGGSVNFQIVPLVYALMTLKSEELYQKLFEVLNELANENQLELNPEYILTDFEKGAVNAVKSEFPNAQIKGCHFHLGQSVYRHVQSAGLAKAYGDDENLSLLIRYIPALAFLHPVKIPEAFDEVKDSLPSDAEPIIEWFEDNYVRGKIKKLMRNGSIQRYEPLVPPAMWSVFDNTEFAFPRTQNKVDAWHRRWEILIPRSHVGIFTMIKQIQKEQSIVEMEIEKSMRGEPAPKKRKEDEDREIRIKNVIIDRDNRTTMDFLRGIAHNLSL